MSDHTPGSVEFSRCATRTREIRAAIACHKYRLAYNAARTLEDDLLHLCPPAPLEFGASPEREADALVAQAECGSPFGMMLQTRELVSLLDRIVGDADEARGTGEAAPTGWEELR